MNLEVTRPSNRLPFLRHSDEPETGEQQLRDQVERKLEMARAEIEAKITHLKWQQHENEADDAIQMLENQLRTLDHYGAVALSGNVAALIHISHSVSRTLSAGQQAIQQAMDSASFMSSHFMVEASEAVQLSGMAFTQRLTQMSEPQVQAVERVLATQAKAFQTYERRSYGRIEDLAQSKGIDITPVRENRERLLAEREEAEKRKDKAGVYRADALLAYNNVDGLTKVDAPAAEIDKAKDEAAKARERYLKQREIDAMRQGKAQGLSGEALTTHMQSVRQEAASELDREREVLSRRNGVRGMSTEEIKQRDASVINNWAVRESVSNARRVSDGVQENGEVVVAGVDQATKVAKRMELSANEAENESFGGDGLDEDGLDSDEPQLAIAQAQAKRATPKDSEVKAENDGEKVAEVKTPSVPKDAKQKGGEKQVA